MHQLRLKTCAGCSNITFSLEMSARHQTVHLIQYKIAKSTRYQITPNAWVVDMPGITDVGESANYANICYFQNSTTAKPPVVVYHNYHIFIKVAWNKDGNGWSHPQSGRQTT